MDKKILSLEERKAIVATVIEIHEREKQNDIIEAAKQRTRNARIALKNYRKLKGYVANAVADITDAQKILAESLGDFASYKEDLKVESIMRTRERSIVMIAHIDKMLEVYRKMCEATGDPTIERRWKIIYDFYINPTFRMNAEDVADKFHVDRSTVFSDITKACEDLGPLFFGTIRMNI